MKRVKITVAYDGTNYCGWQLQPNGVTIEEILNRGLSDLLREPITVIGASRTDSGVHARGNVAVFDTGNRMPAEKICLALNQRLPEDIRVLQSEEVAPGWHPRRLNATKTYEYRILNRRISMPQERLYTHFCYYDLDVDKMRKAARYLVGEHDFKSFCAARAQAEETVRNIYGIDIAKNDDVIVVRVSGSGFLYHMVRIIVGTLLRVGMGFYPPGHVEEILEARDRGAAGETAPAKGLTLVSIDYEQELPLWHHGENKHWSYDILQSHVRKEQTAYLFVTHCEDAEWERVLNRNVLYAFRNGASQVYVADMEKQRLRQGDAYGCLFIEACAQDTACGMLTRKEQEQVLGLLKEKTGEGDFGPQGLSWAGWYRAVPRGRQ